MKKIFTLIAMALTAIGANAQGSWVAPAELPAAGARVVNDDLIQIFTVYEAKGGDKDSDGNPFTINFSATKTYTSVFNVRVDAAPSADNPTGTQHANGTPLEIKAKKNTDITLYYRRQAANNAYASNDGKDVKLVDQSAPTTPIAAADFSYVDAPDAGYAYTTKKYALEEGKTYTLWARGTTLALYEIEWAAGSGSGGGGGSTVADGTYYISYSIEPALSNETTAEMTNTGSSNNKATWENGFSVMIMRSDKGMSSGSPITVDGTQYTTIKVSNGAQNKLTLPEGKVAESITFYSYVNKDAATERDSYWKEVAGVTYDTPDASGGIFQNYKETEGTPDMRTYSFNGSKLNTITFTNTGEQCCYVIKIDIVTGSPVTGIQTIKAANIDLNAPVYNLSGQKVDSSYKGVVIQNGVKRIQK